VHTGWVVGSAATKSATAVARVARSPHEDAKCIDIRGGSDLGATHHYLWSLWCMRWRYRVGWTHAAQKHFGHAHQQLSASRDQGQQRAQCWVCVSTTHSPTRTSTRCVVLWAMLTCLYRPDRTWWSGQQRGCRTLPERCQCQWTDQSRRPAN
jgi:hypothetical protein